MKFLKCFEKFKKILDVFYELFENVEIFKIIIRKLVENNHF